MATQAEQFAAFQAWQAQQEAAAVTPQDETPAVTLAEVLKALVNSARFPTEATVRSYHEAIDAYFGDKETPDKATND